MISTVSVVLPTYDAENFVERAIASALDQDSPGSVQISEVVAVDDCSKDGTRAVLARLAAREPRIKVLHNPRNLGPAGSRNAGIAVARGEWVALLDADDAFAPGRLAKLIGAASGDIIADLPVLFDLAAGRPAPEQLAASGELQRLAPVDLLQPDPQTGLDLGLLKPVFRRSLAETGVWAYPEDMRHGEDFALYFDLLSRGCRFDLLHEAHYVFSTRIGAISGSYSPGSVTEVDYRALAAHAETLAQRLAESADPDPRLLELLSARAQQARRKNRIYGWTAFRHRDPRRLVKWFRQDRRNAAEFALTLGAKLMGQRGLPD